MRLSVAAVALLAAPLLASCSDDADPIPQPPLAEVVDDPTYDPTLESAEAVMSLVPADATSLRVTDLEQVQLALGFGSTITSESPAAQRARFWRRADRLAPVLDAMLRPDEERLKRFGFGPDDVVWEAHFTGPAGDGFVLKFRDDLDMSRVAKAAKAGLAGLGGSVVVSDARVAAVGATATPEESWAADPALRQLVGPAAAATIVERACAPFKTTFGVPAAALAPASESLLGELDPVESYSVSYGLRLVTVRLGAGRGDAFDRARLADVLPATDPDFGLGYADPVADPGGGRIGYQLGDPAVAVRLAQEQHLPFAVCAPSQE